MSWFNKLFNFFHLCCVSPPAGEFFIRSMDAAARAKGEIEWISITQELTSGRITWIYGLAKNL